MDVKDRNPSAREVVIYAERKLNAYKRKELITLERTMLDYRYSR